MIEYRDATPADGPEIDAMAQIIWIATFGHGVSEADREAYFAKAYGPDGELIRDLADPAHIYRIARAGGRVIAYAKLSPTWVPEAEADSIQLNQFYVAADWHGQGIAQELMAWVESEARARGAGAIYLTVWEENARARRFYERHGFVHIGDYGFAVGDQIDTDHVMRLAL